MQRSSTARSASADSVPALRAARASASSRDAAGCRHGRRGTAGRLRGPDPIFRCTRHRHGIALLFTAASPTASGDRRENSRDRHGPRRARATITRRPRPPGRHTAAARNDAEPPDCRTGRIQPSPRARTWRWAACCWRRCRRSMRRHISMSPPTPTGCSRAACPGGSRPTQFNKAFPQFHNLLVAVIDAQEPEEADATAAALAAALAKDHTHFNSVRRPDASPVPPQGGAAVSRHEAA